MAETSPFGLAVKELQKLRIQILVGNRPRNRQGDGRYRSRAPRVLM
jgi:hypothetical protein